MAKKRIAFTLIELLVVVAIIGLLVAILMPSLAAARSQAKAGVCLSNLKRLGTGVAIYLNTDGDKMPPFRLKQGRATSDDPFVNAHGRKSPRWQWFIAAEVGPVIDPELFQSEIESSGYFQDSSIGREGELGTTMTNRYFVCPSLDDDTEFDVRNGAYGYNYQYLGNSRRDADESRWDNFPVGASRLKAAGRTVLFADSRGAGRNHGKHSYSLDPPRLATERNALRFGPGESDVPAGLNASLYQYSPVEARHGLRGNVVFVDSHAEAMKLKDLGYQLNEEGVARPILDPSAGTYTATNKLWNGEGLDPIAAAHYP